MQSEVTVLCILCLSSTWKCELAATVQKKLKLRVIHLLYASAVILLAATDSICDVKSS